ESPRTQRRNGAINERAASLRCSWQQGQRAQSKCQSNIAGSWCQTKWETIYKRCSDPAPIPGFVVERTSWSSGTGDEVTCTLKAVRKSKYGGHRLSAVCHKTDDDKGWHVGRTLVARQQQHAITNLGKFAGSDRNRRDADFSN